MNRCPHCKQPWWWDRRSKNIFDNKGEADIICGKCKESFKVVQGINGSMYYSITRKNLAKKFSA